MPRIGKDALTKIPGGVWVLGFVSLLMDVSSEMIHSLLPLFMVTVLGSSALTVGVIEGIAESTALLVKVFSGALSDYLGKRKGLALFGYAMGALTKPMFALASGMGMVLAARFLDRVGKGVRGAPRDALIARDHPCRDTRRGVWVASIAGYCRCVPRAVAGCRLDVVVGQ